MLAILFIRHYKIILVIDSALDTEHSAFIHIKQAVDSNQSILFTYYITYYITYSPYTHKQWKMRKVESDLVG